MDITLKTALVNTSSVELSAADGNSIWLLGDAIGASIMNSLWVDFFLVNSTDNIYGWTLIIDVGATLKMGT